MAKAKKSIGSQLVAMRYANETAEERTAAAKHAINVRWAKWRADNGRLPKPGDKELLAGR